MSLGKVEWNPNKKRHRERRKAIYCLNEITCPPEGGLQSVTDDKFYLGILKWVILSGVKNPSTPLRATRIRKLLEIVISFSA